MPTFATDPWGDRFTDDERALLAPFVTDLDAPIFGLRNLPEVVKGALFSRYSRSDKSLRRILLDEFIQAPESGFAAIVGGAARDRRRADRRRPAGRGVLRARADRLWRQLGGRAGRGACGLRGHQQHRGEGAGGQPDGDQPAGEIDPLCRVQSQAGWALPLRARAADHGLAPRRSATRRRWMACSMPTRRCWSRRSHPCARAPRATKAHPSGPTTAPRAPKPATCCAGCCRWRR